MHFHRHSTMLLCSSVSASSRFYQQHLGLEVNADLGWFVGLQRRDRSVEAFELSLCDAAHASVPEALRRPSDGIVLAFQVDDATAVRDRWIAAGVPILSELVDEPWGQRHFYAAAPDGVALDVFQECAPDATWMRENGFA